MGTIEHLATEYFYSDLELLVAMEMEELGLDATYSSDVDLFWSMKGIELNG